MHLENGMQSSLKKLLSYGFTASIHDPCLFTKGENDSFLCLIVYVDDILVSGPSSYLIEDFKNFMHTTSLSKI